MTATTLLAPSAGMPDLAEKAAFYDNWNHAIGPVNGAVSSTEKWLRGFGSQTKWLTGDAWTWWIENFSPPNGIDRHQARNFIALIIGILEDRSPRGQAVLYAGEMFRFLESDPD